MPDLVHAHTPRCKCLACGHEFDSAANLQGAAGPSTGDVTFCLNCAHLMFFNEDLTVREPTPSEAARLGADGRLMKIKELLLESVAMKRRVH